jgi:UDP-2-acetamido-3-amino-2,3-dideoxy-glucuronate N-acetyltransferase
VPDYRLAESADLDPTVAVGSGTSIWDLVQVRERAVIGEQCVIGRGAYIGPGVRVGNRVKIQNLALVYEPAVLEDGAFIGPAAILTNDLRPRAVNPDGSPKSAADWEAVGVHVGTGASVGARAVCVAPVTIGRWAMVAAGSTVTRDVGDFALVAGAPARPVGWVGRAGARLDQLDTHRWQCPATHETYVESDGVLSPADEQSSHP